MNSLTTIIWRTTAAVGLSLLVAGAVPALSAQDQAETISLPPGPAATSAAATDVAQPVTGEAEEGDGDFKVTEEVTEELIQQTDLSDAGQSYIDEILDARSHTERLEGRDITFIYSSGDRRDPMIIPWIRREVERRTLLQQAANLMRYQEFGEALEIYQRLVDEYPGTPEAVQAQQAISQIGAAPRGSEPDGQRPSVVLPLPIREGLRGIIYERNNAVCMIGDDFYEAGDLVPGYDVTVQQINEETVVFLYQGHEFEVPVATTAN